MLKFWDVDLLLLVCRLLDPKDDRNSYWVPNYPVVFLEYLPAFQPPRSFHVAMGGRGGRGGREVGKEPFCGWPQLWRNLRSYQHAGAWKQWDADVLVSELQAGSCTENHLSPSFLQETCNQNIPTVVE